MDGSLAYDVPKELEEVDHEVGSGRVIFVYHNVSIKGNVCHLSEWGVAFPAGTLVSY